MNNFEFSVQIVLLIVFIVFDINWIVNRICDCIEKKNLYTSFTAFINTENGKNSDISKAFGNILKENTNKKS